MTKINITSTIGNGVQLGKDYDNSHDRYEQFLASVQSRFNSFVKDGLDSIYTTNAMDLFEIFLSNLPAEAQPHYKCRKCKDFFDRFGGLVTINDKGNIKSILWDEKNTPPLFAGAVEALKYVVKQAEVTGVFATDTKTLGTPMTDGWEHVAVRLPDTFVNDEPLMTAYEVSADKLERKGMVERILKDFPQTAVKQALELFQNNALHNPPKYIGVVQWLDNLQTAYKSARYKKNKENIIWRAAGTDNGNFSHMRASVVGELISDIRDGYDTKSVIQRFNAKTDELYYKRAQAEAAAGNLKRAQEIVDKMGLEPSFERAYATLDQLKLVWQPSTKKTGNPVTSGIFANLQAKNTTRTQPLMNMPARTMTWVKFRDTVLANAKEIEYLVETGYNNYTAILTALNQDAPPIYKWDNEEQRNPFSWYVYHSGSPANVWGLTYGYRKVTGITTKPSKWYGGDEFTQDALFLILDGAKDRQHDQIGNAMFPDDLKGYLHEIRASIENYSKTAKIHGYDNASACGVMASEGTNWNITLRVTTDTAQSIIKIDRWD
jgi:hypothetical protein